VRAAVLRAGELIVDEVPDLQLSVKISGLVPALADSIADLPELAADIERWGADRLVLGEHVFTTADTVHPGGVKLGTGSSYSTLPIYAAIAARTERIVLNPSILIAGLHHPVVLAKEAATLQALSRGRFEIGLGSGWLRDEFEVLGVPFAERFDRLEELIAICRTIWAGQPASYAGRFTRFEGIYAAPPPDHPIAIWLGGNPTANMARRVVHLADHWTTGEEISVDEIRTGIDLIERECAAAGKDPSAIRVRATLTLDADPATARPDAGRLLRERALELINIGVTEVTLPLAKWVDSRAAAEQLVGELLDVLGRA
jgi:probable F420-dependent oxidoreductase